MHSRPNTAKMFKLPFRMKVTSGLQAIHPADGPWSSSAEIHPAFVAGQQTTPYAFLRCANGDRRIVGPSAAEAARLSPVGRPNTAGDTIPSAFRVSHRGARGHGRQHLSSPSPFSPHSPLSFRTQHQGCTGGHSACGRGIPPHHHTHARTLTVLPRLGCTCDCPEIRWRGAALVPNFLAPCDGYVFSLAACFLSCMCVCVSLSSSSPFLTHFCSLHLKAPLAVSVRLLATRISNQASPDGYTVVNAKSFRRRWVRHTLGTMCSGLGECRQRALCPAGRCRRCTSGRTPGPLALGSEMTGPARF